MSRASPMPTRRRRKTCARCSRALTAGAALILPGEPLDAICYSCTSASVVIGDAEVEAAIQAGQARRAGGDAAAGAAMRGLKALGARRISMLTPYTVETSAADGGLFRGARLRHRPASPASGSTTTARWRGSRRRRVVELAREAIDAECRGAVRLLHGAARGDRRRRTSRRRIGRPVVTQQPGHRLELPAPCGDDDAASANSGG